MPQSEAHENKRARAKPQEKPRQRVPSTDRGQTTPGPAAGTQEPQHLWESSLGSDFSERTFERHAELLGDSRMSHRMYAQQRTAFVMQLQRDYGNRYVQRLVNHISQKRAEAVQAKLTVGPAGDEYEQEADRVAKQVVGMTEPSAQRQEEEELQAKPLAQRKVPLEGGDVEPAVEQSIEQSQGRGQALPDSLRTSMEGAFGADFSGVRVHSDAQADALNDSMSARAFTTGKDIFIRQGEYNPGSSSGQELLAHELTHVVQQKQGGTRSPVEMKGGGRNYAGGMVNEADALGRAVVQRAEKTTTLKKNTILWDSEGKLSAITVNGGKPGEAGLNAKAKTFFRSVTGIGAVKFDPTGSAIMVYPRDKKSGIWQIGMRGGDPQWSLLSETESVPRPGRGVFVWQKDTVAKSRKWMDGIEGLRNAGAVASKIFDNMRDGLSYKLGPSSRTEVVNGAKTGECDAINGALGMIIQAGLATLSIDEAEVRLGAEHSPFLTPDGDSGDSVINGYKTNIYTVNGEKYEGSRIKFDNHNWVTVGGRIYDLVAGIKDGGASCVDQKLKEEPTGVWTGGGFTVKADSTKAPWKNRRDPWTRGFDLEQG